MSDYRFDQDGRRVSDTDIIRDFLELDEPLKPAIALIIHRTKQLRVANWPLPSHDGGGKSGKPSSRAPGREQCAGEIKWLLEKLPNLAHDIDNKWARVTSRQRHEHGITSMGGVDITIPTSTGPSVNRRKDGTFASPARILVVAKEE